jgi:hypothetical protein
MLARSLATYCLFTACVFAGSSDSIEPNLAVYLKTAPGQSDFPLQWMQRELSLIMIQAGYAIEWRDPHMQQQAYSDVPKLAVVEMRGVCGLPSSAFQAAALSENREPLASTPVIDGHVLPFSTVNCEAVTRLLTPSLAAEAGARRDFLYGRALARIVAHEIYHVLTGSGGHDREGIAKAGFTAHELIGERFEFQEATLAKLKPAPATGGASGTEIVSGRQ